MTAPLSFGQRVRQARKAARLTQAQLALVIGVAKDTLSRYERGDIQPAANKVADITRALGVSGHWLLTGEGEASMTTPQTDSPALAAHQTATGPTAQNSPAITAAAGFVPIFRLSALLPGRLGKRCRESTRRVYSSITCRAVRICRG